MTEINVSQQTKTFNLNELTTPQDIYNACVEADIGRVVDIKVQRSSIVILTVSRPSKKVYQTLYMLILKSVGLPALNIRLFNTRT